MYVVEYVATINNHLPSNTYQNYLRQFLLKKKLTDNKKIGMGVLIINIICFIKSYFFKRKGCN